MIFPVGIGLTTKGTSTVTYQYEFSRIVWLLRRKIQYLSYSIDLLCPYRVRRAWWE